MHLRKYFYLGLSLLTIPHMVMGSEDDQRPNEYESVSSGVNTHQTNLVTLIKQLSTVYPDVAKRFEEVYDRFMKAKLIYTHPQTKQPKEWAFDSIFPQLFQAGVYSVPFDLSGCDGDTRKAVNINTGFRVNRNPTNDNEWKDRYYEKVLLERADQWASMDYNPIFDRWSNQNVNYVDGVTKGDEELSK